MINHPIVITDVKEQLAEVELLGHDADVIAKDIYDILDIVLGEWQSPKLLPGALVPVVLDAVDRALLQQLEYLRSHVSDEEVLVWVEAQTKKLSNRISLRESKKPQEEAA